ncbi:MAG: AMIN domain-containing protein, partial [Gemmatimonadetes bacterium]|nr:AMIN domain-containing protein [Gemmatimonadota bacterium]
MIDLRSTALALGLVLGVASATAPPAVAQAGPYEVVDFRIQPEGDATRIVIETTGEPRYSDEFQPLPPHLTIELTGASPTLPLRAYEDVYRGGVRYVVVSQPTPGRTRFDIALSGVASYAVFQEGSDLVVTFDNPGGEFPVYVANPARPRTRPMAPELAARRVVVPFGESTGLATASLQEMDEGLPGIDGQPVTLSFQEADVNTVARAFAEVGGRSIVVGGVGDILITADIRGEPWDEALVAIMRANGLDVRMTDGIIRVDSIERLRQAETLVDLETVVLRLNYIAAQDAAAVVEPLKSERGAVQPDPKTNSLVVTDVPGRIRQIGQVIDELDIQTPQVTIKAKIVFVNKVDLRELGVRWRAENLGNPTVDTHVLAEADGTLADPFLDLSIGTLASGLNIGGLLQALEQRELADVQAEPQTTVLNNLPAEIFVGERTPIRVLDVGADTPEARASVELIETGIILNVTPHITRDGKVLMKLVAERSGV